jgi:hypothetical protein
MKNRSVLLLVATGAVIAILGALPFVANAVATTPNPWERPATNEDYGMLVWANAARAEPSADGGTESPRLPMLWSDELAMAARAHSYDMAVNRCFSHNSCNGQSWSKRVGSFYPGWSGLGENIGAGSTDPADLHSGWMHSPGHRANILGGGFTDFGGSIWMGEDGFGPLPLGTEDFGTRGLRSLEMYPLLPAGYVWPRQGAASVSRTLLVNAYNLHGVGSVVAVVNGQSVPMSLYRGTTTNGTYRVVRALSGSGCQTLHFEARSGTRFERWPRADEILVGVNRDDCAERGTGGSGGGGSSTTSTTTTSTSSTTTTTVRPTGAPVVTIDAPTSGARLTGHVTIRAHATDEGKVTRIEVYVDNRMLVRRSSASVARKWMAGVSAVKPGAHTITVKAYDDAGNVGTKSVTVTK